MADEEGLQHVEDWLEAVELGHLLLGLDLDLHAAGGAARAVEAAVGTEQNVGDLHRSSSQSIRSASFIAASLGCLLLDIDTMLHCRESSLKSFVKMANNPCNNAIYASKVTIILVSVGRHHLHRC